MNLNFLLHWLSTFKNFFDLHMAIIKPFQHFLWHNKQKGNRYLIYLQRKLFLIIVCRTLDSSYCHLSKMTFQDRSSIYYQTLKIIFFFHYLCARWALIHIYKRPLLHLPKNGRKIEYLKLPVLKKIIFV